MTSITLRLRLTTAALTVAAALGGAFLVSSAPAQATLPHGNTADSTAKTNRTEELQEHLKSAQDKLASAQTDLDITKLQLTNEMHATLPQANAATLAKAFNLEGRVGWSLSAAKLFGDGKELSLKKHNLQYSAKMARYEAEALARLKQCNIQEAKIFPQTAETTQRLPHIHSLSEHLYQQKITVFEDQVEAEMFSKILVGNPTEKHLVSSQPYPQGRQANLSVTARDHVVSFQIYDNGKLTKTQQMTGKPAPAIRAAQNQADARTHMVMGYGLVAWKIGKEFQCRAVEDSPASRLGILTDRNYLVLAVNGQPVPQSATQFAEIVRAAPPLRLRLEFPRQPVHTVTFQRKEAYIASTDAANTEDRIKYVQSAQEEAAKSKMALAQTNRQLVQEISSALPLGDAQTQEKALNLEKRIGWDEYRVNGSREDIAWYKKKHNLKRAAQEVGWVANVRSGLDAELIEEANLFPKTAQTSQQLLHIHTLAEQAGPLSLTAMEKQIQAQAITSVMQQRSPDMSL